MNPFHEEHPASQSVERSLPDLVSLRSKVVHLAFVYVTLLALIPVGVTLYRAAENGYSWYFWVQMLCYSFLAAGCLLSRRIPSRVASCLIVSLILILGVAGVAAWGPAPSRFVILCFACLFTAIFHGSAASVRVVALCTLAIGAIAALGEQRLLLPSGDHVSDHSPQQWLVSLMSFAFYTSVGCLLVGWVMQTLQKSIGTLSQREEALEGANLLLQQQAAQLEEQAVELEEQTQVLMEQRDRAEQAAVAKDQFLSVISHELRTPLNPILGFLEVFDDKPCLNPEARNQLALMRRSGQQLLRMIERLVDYSELDRGEVAFRASRSACETLRREVEQRYGGEAAERNLTFAATWHDDKVASIQLELDKRRVLQVVDELVWNAFKFTESGSVTVGFSLLVCDSARGRLRITITDTGVGIDSAQLATLFDPFSRGDTSRTRSTNGLGIGLATCHAIVSAMKGRLEVSSQPGEGSVFTLELPVGLAQAVETPPLRVPSRRHFETSIEVLVAEDDIVNQKVVQTLLRRMGASSICVENGKQAVETLRQKTFDLVLMDVSMPIMDGISATREIRRSEVRPRIPIVALTAHSYAKSEAACLDAGMDAFLTKPIKADILFETISQLVVCESENASSDSVGRN